MIQIDRLQQICNEDIQSRKNIRAAIKTDIESGYDNMLEEMFNKTIIEIANWIKEPSEIESQLIIKRQLNLMNIKEVASEIFLSVTKEDKRVPIQTVIHSIAMGLDWPNHLEAIKTAGELLGVCVDTGLYNIIIPNKSHKSLMIESLVGLDLDTKLFIERTRYMMPLVCKPDNWKNNHSGGYLSISDSVLLGKPENHHEEYQALDALNIIQDIEWELDTYMLEFYEEPNKKLDTPEKVKAFQLMVETSEDVYSDLLTQGNSFWFSARYDTRGRLYTQGYHVNLQSTNYKKSLLNFAKRQLITNN